MKKIITLSLALSLASLSAGAQQVRHFGASLDIIIAQGLNWQVPAMYGGGNWSFGPTGYIPDAVLQYVGPDGNCFVMFPPEGAVCVNGGFHDNGGTDPAPHENNFTLPTHLHNLANPTGQPTNSINPKIWVQIQVNGTNVFIPAYQ